MNINIRIIWIFLVGIICSCNSQEANERKIRDDVKNNSGIIILDFKLTESVSESAVGDYSESILLDLVCCFCWGIYHSENEFKGL